MEAGNVEDDVMSTLIAQHRWWCNNTIINNIAIISGNLLYNPLWKVLLCFHYRDEKIQVSSLYVFAQGQTLSVETASQIQTVPIPKLSLYMTMLYSIEL